MNVNGSLEGGVGNAANLHLSAALEGNVLPGVITINTLADILYVVINPSLRGANGR